MLIASMAASAGGSVMNARQQSKNAAAGINARNAAAQSEVERQRQLQNQNTTTLNNELQSLGGDAQSKQFTDLVMNRENAAEANTPAANAEFGSFNASTPQVVKEDADKQLAGRLALSKDKAKAMAKLGAYSDANLTNNLGIQDASNRINLTNALAQGSLNANQTEQQAAVNNAKKSSSPIGDILSAAGAAGSMIAGPQAIGNTFGAPVVDPSKTVAGTYGPPIPTFDQYGSIKNAANQASTYFKW